MRPPEVVVPIGGLIFVSLVLLYVAASTGFAPFSLIFMPFVALFLASAYGVWRRNRYGYIGSTVLSAVFLVLEGTQIADALAAVTIPSEFLSVITAVPILFATLVYSAIGLRRAWAKNPPATPGRMIPASSFVIFLILGFIVGGIVVGMVAAGTESRLLGSASPADVTIVQGAGNEGNPQYYTPSTFSVKAGGSVTWVNHDGTSHTITSSGNNLFDSGVIQTGQSYTFKFNDPGTYDYYCTLHPWMKASVTVTS